MHVPPSLFSNPTARLLKVHDSILWSRFRRCFFFFLSVILPILLAEGSSQGNNVFEMLLISLQAMENGNWSWADSLVS